MLSTPKRVKESPNPPLTPRAAAPAAACVAGRSTGQHMPPQQALKTNGNNAPPHKTKNLLVLPLPRRHAWLAGPPANTCPRNKPSKQTATTPPHKTKNPSCRHSVAACVSDHSRGQPMLPQRLPVQPQKNPPKQKPPRAAAPAAACVAGRSTGQHMPPQQLSKQTATTPPPHKTKNPSCRHSVAACVSDHSRGQALPPANPLSTNGNNAKTDVIPEFSFRDSGMKISGISAARRRIPPELRLRCREATAREGRGASANPPKFGWGRNRRNSGILALAL